MLNKDAARLKEELRELFRERQTKSELLSALAARVKMFRNLKGTLFQNSINEFIIFRAEDDCEIVMYDEDVKRIWDD